ncbi:hypothetical protein [Raoultibacter phocaeensis]|uniref:hypothetical protein n=1 Tax=Raoultibacter phocaeensis TaxID=2479841 RepID=UPI00111B7DAE|nr:hypothetical protein [Raoultibacter phocaeensis]
MKATKQEMALRKYPTASERIDVAAINAKRPKATAPISNLHGEMLWSVVKKLREPELLAFLANPEERRAAKIAAVAALEDIDLLIAVATAAVPLFARKDALVRIDELCDGKPLEVSDALRLVPCLNDKDLLAFTVSLMDMSDFDWCAYSTERTVDALCAAMYECQSMYESVLLEDSFAHLSHSRPDLAKNLRACSPEKFLTEDTFAPVTPTVMYLDRYPVDNVA